MTLKETRINKGLTQAEAASLINVPLRTYKRYESNECHKDSFKYEMMIKALNEKTLIDEHGLLSIETIKQTVVPILERHNISYCYLFGSYAENKARENSDVDLLVDTNITGFDFLCLIDELRDTLCKKVDLIRLKDIEPNNPIALEILKTGIKIK